MIEISCYFLDWVKVESRERVVSISVTTVLCRLDKSKKIWLEGPRSSDPQTTGLMTTGLETTGLMTTDPLTTGPLTTGPLTTGPLTTGPLTNVNL